MQLYIVKALLIQWLDKHIQAFGLMQIVPRSAGIDSYNYLYNKKRVLSSDYLYDPSKNITIGSGGDYPKAKNKLSFAILKEMKFYNNLKNKSRMKK